ncbi:MAG TPA: lytic transglycosylase domain-containing protein [Thermoanaerobacterales bacterium]|nr:lytic transglycosylase domain-containing protein [Thermoanaerobacterales bacterium]
MQSFIFAFVISTSLLLNPISNESYDSIDNIIGVRHGTLNERGRAVIANNRFNIALKIKNYNPDLTSKQIDLIIKSVYKYCKKYDIPEEVVFAVIAAESKFDPMCRGTLDDTGLMQIREKYAFSWARRMGIEYRGIASLYDIESNVHMGVYILDFLFNKYNNQLDKVLVAYNRGHGYVDRALASGGRLPDGYLKEINKHYRNIYKKELAAS